MSVSDRRFRFSVGAFVQPPDGAQLSGNTSQCPIPPPSSRDSFHHQCESWTQRGADPKGPRFWLCISIPFHTWSCSRRTFCGDLWKGVTFFFFLFLLFFFPGCFVSKSAGAETQWGCQSGRPGGKRKGGSGIRRL